MKPKDKAKLGENYRYSNNVSISISMLCGLILGSYALGFISYDFVVWIF